VAVLHRRKSSHDRVHARQQRTRTVDFNANDVGFVPSNAGHYVENTGGTDLVFLETFATDEFMDVSLNQWLRRVPSEMLQAHLGITPEQAKTIPAENLAVI
jgi:oxalate decarboxylase